MPDSCGEQWAGHPLRYNDGLGYAPGQYSVVERRTAWLEYVRRNGQYVLVPLVQVDGEWQAVGLYVTCTQRTEQVGLLMGSLKQEVVQHPKVARLLEALEK